MSDDKDVRNEAAALYWFKKIVESGNTYVDKAKEQLLKNNETFDKIENCRITCIMLICK